MQYFDIEDLAWISSEAKKIWHGDPMPGENRLHQLMLQSPQPILRLPSWIDFSIDPHSEQYYSQIMLLWKTIFETGSGNASVSYDVTEHEQDAAYDACPIRFPGYMARRDPGAARHAGYEFAMLGDVLVHSGLTVGMKALEYGAGSGNIAINLARLGISVDTVDISEKYCDHIRQNAEFYGVDLRAYNQQFGFNPRNDAQYDSIIFHACFHHSIDHNDLVETISHMLSNEGTIILSNEPIYEDFYCPWGMRLDPECISVIAGRGWMELGFRFDYLREVFFRHGLILYKILDNFSGVNLFIAKKIPRHVSLTDENSQYHTLIDGTYGVEYSGMWTGPSAKIPLSKMPESKKIVIEIANLFPIDKLVEYEGGAVSGKILIAPAGSERLTIDVTAMGPEPTYDVILKCDTHKPVDHFEHSQDVRELGCLLKSISFA